MIEYDKHKTKVTKVFFLLKLLAKVTLL